MIENVSFSGERVQCRYISSCSLSPMQKQRSGRGHFTVCVTHAWRVPDMFLCELGYYYISLNGRHFLDGPTLYPNTMDFQMNRISASGFYCKFYQIIGVFMIIKLAKLDLRNIWFISVSLQRFKDTECSHFWSLDSPHF